MAHRVLLAISMSFYMFSCNSNATLQETSLQFYNAASLNLSNNNGIAICNGKPFTGVVYGFFPGTKDTAEVVGFVNGKEEGEWRQFYNNGQLKAQRFYNNGIKAKTLKEWWPNGVQSRDGFFVNGEHDGLYQEWDSVGKLMKAMHYKLGYEEGSQKMFYANGKIKSNYIVVNGRRYGLLGTKNCVNVTDSIFKN